MTEKHLPTQRELPFHGELNELAVIGTGKDAILRFTVRECSGFALALGGARSNVRCTRGIEVTTEAVGDSSLAVTYRPEAGWRMCLVRAIVSYPGSNEECARDCRTWDRLSKAAWPETGPYAVGRVDVELIAEQIK